MDKPRKTKLYRTNLRKRSLYFKRIDYKRYYEKLNFNSKRQIGRITSRRCYVLGKNNLGLIKKISRYTFNIMKILFKRTK